MPIPPVLRRVRPGVYYLVLDGERKATLERLGPKSWSCRDLSSWEVTRGATLRELTVPYITDRLERRTRHLSRPRSWTLTERKR